MKIRKRPIGTKNKEGLSRPGCCRCPEINADVNNSWINKCLESVSADSRLNLSTLLILGKDFIFFISGGRFIDFPSPTVHHCLTERTKQPCPSLPLSPSLEKRSESTRCQSSSFSPPIVKGKLGETKKKRKKEEGGPSHFEVHNLLSPSSLTGLSRLYLCECACISGLVTHGCL